MLIGPSLDTHGRLAIAFSGGADSRALLHLAQRALADRGGAAGDLLILVVDHGLQQGSAVHAAQAMAMAAATPHPHRLLCWEGPKPLANLQQAARMARYALLASAARAAGVTALLTAHTRDDQAETVLMRLARGSGVRGLSGMSRCSERHGVALLRPLLAVPRERLVATLRTAALDWIEDPANAAPRFERVRLRRMMPALAALGLDGAALALVASRASRADAALEAAVDALAHDVLRLDGATAIIRLAPWQDASEELALRVLLRAIVATGGRGLLSASLERAVARLRSIAPPVRVTLHGCIVASDASHLFIRQEAPRRRRPA